MWTVICHIAMWLCKSVPRWFEKRRTARKGTGAAGTGDRRGLGLLCGFSGCACPGGAPFLGKF